MSKCDGYVHILRNASYEWVCVYINRDVLKWCRCFMILCRPLVASVRNYNLLIDGCQLFMAGLGHVLFYFNTSRALTSDEQWKLHTEREDCVGVVHPTGEWSSPRPWTAHQATAGAGKVIICATPRPPPSSSLVSSRCFRSFTEKVSRGRMERGHHRALLERAGRHGQQQLSRQLRRGRTGRPCGIQHGGKTTLQVARYATCKHSLS